jgi:chaperonin cofactor prefoldin
MSENSHRSAEIRAFEQEAEALATYQLDLLAQLERQLRAVHHTMRHIEKLRDAKHRVGPELSNGKREETLAQLAADIADLDSHITSEHDCCVDMQSTIAQMRERISHLRGHMAGANRTAAGSQSRAASE